MHRTSLPAALVAALLLVPMVRADETPPGNPRPDDGSPGSTAPGVNAPGTTTAGTTKSGMTTDGTTTAGTTKAGETTAGTTTAGTTKAATIGVRDAWTTVAATGLRYEAPRYGGDARLLVLPKAASGKPVAWKVYEGKDLDAILSDRSDLQLQPGMPELRTSVASATATTAPARYGGGILTRVEAPRLVYERGIGEEARLYVTEGDETVAYLGSDLDGILRENPSLAQTSGIDDLKTRAAKAVVPPMPRPEAACLLDVRYTPTDVVVNAWQVKDGQWDHRTFRGKTLQDIRERVADFGALVQDEHRVRATGGVRPLGAAPAGGGCPFAGDAPAGVRDDSRAARLGLRDGDVVVEVNGVTVRDGETLRRELESMPPSPPVRLVVMRAGERVTLGS